MCQTRVLPARCGSVRGALTLLLCYCSWGWVDCFDSLCCSEAAQMLSWVIPSWHISGAAAGPSCYRHLRVYPPAPQVVLWPPAMTVEPAGKCPGAEQVTRSRRCGAFIQTCVSGEHEVCPSTGPPTLFLCANTLLPPEMARGRPCTVFEEMPGCFFVAFYGFKCFSFYCTLQMQ